MYKGYPICLEEEGTESVSVLRLKLEPLEEIRLHEEVIPDIFRKICRAICEEGVLQDPIFIDEKSKVILDGMHRATALLKLKSGECKQLFWDEEKKRYIYEKCEECKGEYRNLHYALCCSLDYEGDAVELRKWYRGVVFPFEKVFQLLTCTVTEKKSDIVGRDSFAVLTDGKKYFSLSGTFENVLEKYKALRDVEQAIRENNGRIVYCADEEAFERLKEGEFNFLLVTPTIQKKDVVTFSKKGIPERGEVFPPKSTRHRLSARPLKVNIPLRLLEAGEYNLKQEQLKVFLRRKRRLTVKGRVEQYLEKRKILFGEPGELKELGKNVHLWACEFSMEFYAIKYDVDQFLEEVSSVLIQHGMEMDYYALIRETNRLILLVSDVEDARKAEELLNPLVDSHFHGLEVKNLFGWREDHSPVWMLPMEDYEPSRAYFERNERLIRQITRVHSTLGSGTLKEEWSLEDVLIVTAFHILGRASKCKVFEYLHEEVDDWDTISCHVDRLTADGVLEENKGYALTSRGEELYEGIVRLASAVRSPPSRTFSDVLQEIDSNVTHVIKPDGRKDEFHIGSILESLIFTDMGWVKVADVLDRVADEFKDVDFISSDELAGFVQEYLKERYILSNIPFRYDYFVNARNYIYVKDEKVIPLSRSYIEEDLERFIPDFLEITGGQLSQLSNMVYEGVRFLTVPLVKELYGKEQVVIPKEFLERVEEFLIDEALPVLKKVKERNVRDVLKEELKKAQRNVELSVELFQRENIEFLKYYVGGIDLLSECLSVGVGRVPFLDVFGRLTQLRDVKKSKELVFRVKGDERFLRHMGYVVRRSTSLLDQWRSYQENKGIILDFFEEYGQEWKQHLGEVHSLIKELIEIC